MMNNTHQVKSGYTAAKQSIDGFLRSDCREMSDAETSAAAEQLAQLEEDLWRVILENPSKARFAVLCAEQLIESNPRYKASPELEVLMKRICKPRRSGKAKKIHGRAMNDLVAELLELDLDREIVAVAKDEAIRRGTRRKANGEVVLSQHAASVQAVARRVEAAKNAFIEANQGLVVAVAEKYSQGRMPFSDRIQEGNIGLIKAVNRFDYQLGYKFSTYASWWIRAAIGRALDSKECVVRLPGSAIRSQSQLRKASRKIWLRTGRRPTDEEIAKEAGMGSLRLSRARRNVVSGIYSLDEEVPGSNNIRYIDTLPDETVEDPVEEMQRRVLLEEIHILMDSLTPLERSIIKQRFGLDDEDRATLREIGEQYDLSRERIRQIQNRALEKLRQGMALDAA